MSRFVAVPGLLPGEVSVDPKTIGMILTLVGLAVFVYNVFDPTWRDHNDPGPRIGLAIGAVLVAAGLFTYFKRYKRSN